MNLYKISQVVNNNYDTYSDAVVAAESVFEAQRINPCNYYEADENDHWLFKYADGTKEDQGEMPQFFSWVPVKDVKVELIGTAVDGIKKGVITASFHAG